MSSIFICHSSTDKQFVRLLKARLERYDLKVWVDEDEIRAGDSLIDAVSGAINEMEYLGIVLSPNAVRSRWVKQELELALTGQIESARIKVIPILLRRCDLPPFLKGKKYISFLGWGSKRQRNAGYHSLDLAVQEVVKAVGVDPKDTERWSGRKMILVKDLRSAINEHFEGHRVTLEFFEDRSGLEFIRVDNGDSTFQLYGYWSKPSYIDLLNEVFRKDGEPAIVDLNFVEEHAWTLAERNNAVREICLRYGVEAETFWPIQKGGAWDEYRNWLSENDAISLIRIGDFGSQAKK